MLIVLIGAAVSERQYPSTAFVEIHGKEVLLTKVSQESILYKLLLIFLESKGHRADDM